MINYVCALMFACNAYLVTLVVEYDELAVKAIDNLDSSVELLSTCTKIKFRALPGKTTYHHHEKREGTGI